MICFPVIESVAKQSRKPQAQKLDCRVACAPRNDDGGVTKTNDSLGIYCYTGAVNARNLCDDCRRADDRARFFYALLWLTVASIL